MTDWQDTWFFFCGTHGQVSFSSVGVKLESGTMWGQLAGSSEFIGFVVLPIPNARTMKPLATGPQVANPKCPWQVCCLNGYRVSLRRYRYRVCLLHRAFMVQRYSPDNSHVFQSYST